MIATTLIIGVLLIGIGLGGYIATGMQHFTALIPFIAGDLFVTIGILSAVRPTWRKHLMHGAASLALIGFLGTAMSLGKAVAWLQGTEPQRPAAVLAQCAMAILCTVFIVLAVRSFRQARKAREAAAAH